jgi:methylated-DNA-[protein]-cysteine S-methyltransferase
MFRIIGKGAAMSTQTFDAVLAAPFGAVGIRASDDFLLGLDLLPENPGEKQALHDPQTSLDFPFAVPGTPFQRRVWREIARIPAGSTLTYGELAQRVGSGPRAVANACGANHVPLIVPCHRVVARHGLGGFMQGDARGLAIKEWLLRHEKAI